MSCLYNYYTRYMHGTRNTQQNIQLERNLKPNSKNDSYSQYIILSLF